MTSLLSHQKDAVDFSTRAARERAGREAGKTALAQRIEQYRLGRGVGLLTPQEYFTYRLFDDARYSWSDKQRFLGHAAQHRILSIVHDASWRALVWDKIAFTGLMQSYGFAVPRILGVFHPFRRAPAAMSLPNQDHLRAFLRNGANYPLFCKPNDGIHSVATARLDSYDAASDEVVAHDGQRCHVDAFVGDVSRYLKRAYLFQEVKRPHDRIAAVCGDRIGTARIITLLEADKPELFETLWKIPAGTNLADNFWRRGNLVAAVDRETGRITRVVTGVGHDQREVERHPDTGAVIPGFVLPEWDRATQLVLAASTTLPGIRMQAWDVAICSDGPALIEVNIGGDFILPQVATGRGILNARFRRLLADLGYTHRAPWVSLRLQNAVRRRLKSVSRMVWRSATSGAFCL
jgi:hypothetical protein